LIAFARSLIVTMPRFCASSLFIAKPYVLLTADMLSQTIPFAASSSLILW